MYSCRIFPQNWSQFCIPGQWEGVSSGGAPPKKDENLGQHGGLNDKANTNKKTTMMGISNIGGLGGMSGNIGGSLMNLSPEKSKLQQKWYFGYFFDA